VNFGSLALEVTNVGLKAVTLPHFDSEKVVVILLDLLARGVLSEEHFGYLLEVVERMGRQSRTTLRSRLSSWTKRLGTKADRCGSGSLSCPESA